MAQIVPSKNLQSLLSECEDICCDFIEHMLDDDVIEEHWINFLTGVSQILEKVSKLPSDQYEIYKYFQEHITMELLWVFLIFYLIQI